jgi:aminoglycoside 6'-N-acetyltransferase
MMLLRDATIADLAILQYWDEQPHVQSADGDTDWNWSQELLRQPVWREQLIAELDDRPIGCIQIIDPALEETQYWGTIAKGFRAIDIWIGAASDLGKGYGTTMMQLALARCFADATVHSILIDPLASNTRAHKFYERMGFVFMEQKRMGDDEEDCFIYQLQRELFEMQGEKATTQQRKNK